MSTEPKTTCPKCERPIGNGSTRCWNKGRDYVDRKKITTCFACGMEALAATTQATGGFCKRSECEKRREASKQVERQRAIVEMRVRDGTLQPCPLCGRHIHSSRMEKHTGEKCERLSRPHPHAAVLPHAGIPAWLERLDSAGTLPPLIPLTDVLKDSCFYPSSGLDSSPVLLANGCVHSFIFVDYGTKRDDFLRALSWPGFSPYQPVLHRDVQRQEIVPEGWTARLPRWFDNPGFDGRQRLMEAQQSCMPFAHWSIWQRKKNRGEQVGPRLFSLLFLGGEALASYEGLYRRNGVTPKVLAMIQPGHACGDNWTNFYDPRAPLWEAVTAGEALPAFLLIGGYGRSGPEECPFGEYEFVKNAKTYDGQVRTIDVFTRRDRSP